MYFWYGQHRFGVMMRTSLECAASQQHNGTSPVFIHRIVLKMELFFSSLSNMMLMYQVSNTGWKDEKQLHLENYMYTTFEDQA